jgi:FkbM family methyltransferase
VARIFLDVGGYAGESARAALDPGFGFDCVYCFEPVAECQTRIARIPNKRLVLVRAGLLDSTCTRPVFHPGTLGASIFPDAPWSGKESLEERCNFVEAASFFRTNIKESDAVWMKLNCEGAEIPILKNLIESGEARKLRAVLIDFDAAKIPSQQAHVAQAKELLEDVSFKFSYPEDVQFGMINNYGGNPELVDRLGRPPRWHSLGKILDVSIALYAGP